MDEEWRPLLYGDLDLSDKFEISSLGHIRNTFDKRILKTFVNKKGYETICISKGKKFQKCLRIHRAVAYMFLDNPEGLPIVNHIDGNKTNNAVTNLEWCSYKENTQHAIRTGLFNNGSKDRRKIVYCVEDKKYFESITEAAKYILNLPGTQATKLKSVDDTIRKAIKEKRKAYGRKWQVIKTIEGQKEKLNGRS